METATSNDQMEKIYTQRAKVRESELFSLGFSKSTHGFSFKELHVIPYCIQYMNDRDWIGFIECLKESVLRIKTKMNEDVTDKDKLEVFRIALGNITGPELKGDKERELAEVVLYMIGQAREWLKEELILLK